MISLKRLKSLMISLKAWWMFQISLKRWWMFQISADFLKWQTTSVQTPPKPSKRLKNTPALRARGLHTRSRWSSVISKRNQTNTFELMAFFWHGNSASVRLQNPPKAFKTLRKPSTFGTGPYTGRNARVRFSWRPLPSNRADFLKTLQISADFLKTP